MLRKKHLAILSLLLLAALTLTASTWPHSPTPDPFGKYLVYSATGVYDPSIPPAEGDLAVWFHKEVMGRDDAALEAERAAADAYFAATFGNLYTGSLEAFGVDPRNEYRAYYISGMRVPSEGFVVRDGGFRTVLTNGGIVVFGNYNIKVTKQGEGGPEPETIIIHYESADPIFPNADGSLLFRCRLSSDAFDDFGGGLAQGISAAKTLPDGRVVANIRNILTFPGLGFGAQ